MAATQARGDRVTVWQRTVAACTVAACLTIGNDRLSAATHFLLVEGLGGTQQYAERFRNQVERMSEALRKTVGDQRLVTVLAGGDATSGAIGTAFERMAISVQPGDALAVLLIGHGTHDGSGYKFNIPGPDISGSQLKRWLDSVPAARQLVVSTTSSSGGMLEALKAPHRVVITATKSGRERNATIFGEFFAEAFGEAGADTNRNDAISALEAFQYAERKVKGHYADRQRLATEHPQLQGDRADAFLLARLAEGAALAESEDTRALLEQREGLEGRIAELTLRKDSMEASEYLEALEELLLEMAEIQRRISEAAEADQVP